MSRISGGSEVLDLVQGDKSEVTYEIEVWQAPYCPEQGSTTQPNPRTFAVTSVPLPKIFEQVQTDKIKYWECHKVETGLLDDTTVSSTDDGEENGNSGPGGAHFPGFNGWAVSGDPLVLVQAKANTAFDPKITATCDKHGTYQFTEWKWDPFRRRNAQWTYRHVGGQAPWTSSGNSQSTNIAVDSHGWGVICYNGVIFLTSNDSWHIGTNYTSHARWYKLHLRQRYIRNTVTLAELVKDKITRDQAEFRGSACPDQVVEVTMTSANYQGPIS